MAAADRPVLSGRFQAEAYATLELKTEGDHVTGHVVHGGDCRFDAQREVLVGSFEGSVLVARLTLCQKGDLCPPDQTYTVLGFYNEEDSSVVAHVRLSPGCTSQAVQKSGRFVLTPVGKEGSRGPGGEHWPDPGGMNIQEAAKEASKLGQQFYKQSKWGEAAAQFRQSIEIDPGDENWPAYLGLGSSLLKQNKTVQAIKELDKAHRARPQNSFILYMLGSAHAQKRDKPKAMDYLRSAVKMGFDLSSYVETDPDLTRVMNLDPQFKELLKSSREKNARGPAASGTPNP
ncbi:tetratricopeptide repeat protein [Hyalangium gracile]|uniref:tetratricopeptide repeat protein n=1 Tax=Hyalangium gracile TaxID=394092 RepID=UPI001CD03565|nr:tetratricopeptide repeat protein [Hyalangium gracile]